MTSERRGLAECASSAAAFGSVGVLVAFARSEHVGTTTLLASRYALGALALWGALLILRRPLPSLRVGLIAVALGATTYAAASATYLASIDRMGAGPAGVVSYCYPVLVMAGAIMLGRERLSRRRAAALGLAVTGVGLLVAGGGLGAVNAPGALLAFASASVYTVYALVPTAFAVSAFLAGLGRIGPSRASIASSLEPVVAVACGVLVLGERLVPVQFLGAGLVIAAVLAIELRRLPRLRVRLFPRLVPRLPLPESSEV